MRKIYADNSSIRDPKFYTEPDYANYKYVLNLPGKTDGSYSRNLNHLWYVGAAVLLWDTPAVEWYYPALKHGATHAAINRTTARAVVEALDASLCSRLGGEAIVRLAASCGETLHTLCLGGCRGSGLTHAAIQRTHQRASIALGSSGVSTCLKT